MRQQVCRRLCRVFDDNGALHIAGGAQQAQVFHARFLTRGFDGDGHMLCVGVRGVDAERGVF